MFTIKHVSPEGHETLYEATEVSFAPDYALQTANSTGLDTVWYTTPIAKEIRSIDRGRVFVTNETGATVAKYDLNNHRPVEPGALTA